MWSIAVAATFLASAAIVSSALTYDVGYSLYHFVSIDNNVRTTNKDIGSRGHTYHDKSNIAYYDYTSNH